MPMTTSLQNTLFNCWKAFQKEPKLEGFNTRAAICQLRLTEKPFKLSFPPFYLVGMCFSRHMTTEEWQRFHPSPLSKFSPSSSVLYREPGHISPQLTSNQRLAIAPRMKSKFLILAYKSLQDPVLDKRLSGLVCLPPPPATSQPHQQSVLQSFRDHSACLLLSRCPSSSVPMFPLWTCYKQVCFCLNTCLNEVHCGGTKI